MTILFICIYNLIWIFIGGLWGYIIVSKIRFKKEVDKFISDEIARQNMFKKYES